jgi:thymidylate kinase
LIVTGPPGAGKSTVARVVADRFERSVLVEGDAFFRFIARGAIPPWLREANEQNEVVTQAAAAASGRYAADGFTTIYDGMVGPWFLPTFLAASGLDRVEYVVLLPSIERCLERVGTRKGHGFKDEGATRHMYRQFARADIDQRHILVDPPDKPDDVADLIVPALEEGLLTFGTSARIGDGSPERLS